MKNFIFYIVLFFVGVSNVNAQTINLEFPYFAGQAYDFTIFQGDKRITLQSNTIPKGGKVQLILPKEYKGYKGIAQWYLTNSKTGGGLDLIINNEDFSVTCLDSIPTAESIVYKNTTENLIDKATYKKQQQLFEKHDAMLATKRAYDKESNLYKLASTEYTSLLQQYVEYSKGLSTTTLYADKFRQIVNITMGIGTIITTDEKEKANNINDFIVNELDFEVLYTSNHWEGVINSWVQIQTIVLKDDSKFLEDSKTILQRLPSNKIYTDFVSNMTKELTTIGKDYILDALTSEIKHSKRLLHYDGVLNIYQQDLSGTAPDISIVTYYGTNENKTKKNTVLKSTELNSKFTLLVFYKSGCGPCEDTMKGLMQNYNEIVSKGYRIITIAADIDEETYIKTSQAFPWKDKYCDFEGSKGINFKNYAVLGTPTIYSIDAKGFIKSKIATIDEFLSQVKSEK